MTRSLRLTSYDDMAFTPPQLAAPSPRANAHRCTATAIRNYPVEMAMELFRGIPQSALWIVPQAVTGPSSARWPGRSSRPHSRI